MIHRHRHPPTVLPVTATAPVLPPLRRMVAVPAAANDRHPPTRMTMRGKRKALDPLVAEEVPVDAVDGVHAARPVTVTRRPMIILLPINHLPTVEMRPSRAVVMKEAKRIPFHHAPCVPQHPKTSMCLPIDGPLPSRTTNDVYVISRWTKSLTSSSVKWVYEPS